MIEITPIIPSIDMLKETVVLRYNNENIIGRIFRLTGTKVGTSYPVAYVMTPHGSIIRCGTGKIGYADNKDFEKEKELIKSAKEKIGEAYRGFSVVFDLYNSK